MDLEINEENLTNILTSSQIFQIKQQILAYKHIIKGLPIPKEIEKNLLQISKEQWEIEKEKIHQRSIKFYKEKLEKNNELMELINNKFSKKVEEKVDFFIESYYSNGNNNELLQKNLEKRKKNLEEKLKIEAFTAESKKKLESDLKFLQNKDIYAKLKDNIHKKLKNEDDLPFKLYERNFFSLNKYRREKPQKKLEVFIIKFEILCDFLKNRLK